MLWSHKAQLHPLRSATASKKSTNVLCGLTELLSMFLYTNKHENHMAFRIPMVRHTYVPITSLNVYFTRTSKSLTNDLLSSTLSLGPRNGILVNRSGFTDFRYNSTRSPLRSVSHCWSQPLNRSFLWRHTMAADLICITNWSRLLLAGFPRQLKCSKWNTCRLGSFEDYCQVRHLSNF